MLAEHIRRIFLVQDIVDFRKQFNGLLSEAYKRGCNPYLGDTLVFINRTGGQIRLLLGDQLGLFIVSRRFDGRAIGRRRLLANLPDAITPAELAVLLEGKSFQILQKAQGWQPNRNLLEAMQGAEK